jgi:alkanesulfonate monooxygenase SsuD/methylene tetrahydromethanopterin reductase-like flavin-dependent oxidoreductase (luciferase family)
MVRRKLQFGVFFIAPGRYSSSVAQTYREVLEEVAWAEELGFDSVWFAEHHFDPHFCLTPSPNLMAAAAATVTQRIHIGLAVNVLPLHHPLRLAEEGAMLDQLSQGRLLWGIGRGISRKEFDPWQVPLGESAERTHEAHDLILQLWQQEEVHFEGQFWTVNGARLTPRPYRSPHPPVWSVATSPPSVRWAAERGYPIMQVARPVSAMAESWQLYRSHYVETHGHPPEHEGLVPLRYLFVAESDAEARRLAEPHMSEFWQRFSRIDAPDREDAKPERGYEFAFQNRRLRQSLGYDDLVREGIALIGSPKSLVETIAAHAEATEMRYLLCDFWRASLSHEDRRQVMRRFAEEVMPHFQ